MYFQYQVLKTLIEQERVGIYPHQLEAWEITDAFAKQPADLVISSIHELEKENLVSFSSYDKNGFHGFSVSPTAPAFLFNLKEVKHLKWREKWEERAYGYIAGVLSGITVTLIAQWLK